MQKSFQLTVFLLIAILAACLGPGLGYEELTPSSTGTPTQDGLGGIDVLEIISPTKAPLPTATEISGSIAQEKNEIVIAFTGVIAPARCVQAAIDERGGNADYLYAGVREILGGADVTVGVYNATMSASVEHVGCENSWELVGGPENADALKDAGFDVMSVATNHIMDCGKKYCGDIAFFDTLANFNRVGIQAVGAGSNLTEALQPVVVEAGGVRFGFVSLGEVNEGVFAGLQKPGIANLSLEHLRISIAATEQISDVVIVLPHSGPEDFPEVTPQQYYWARHSIALGADLVVTTHAHILQAYEEIDGVPVFYSLGNFVFDQIWARDHQQGAILLVTFLGDEIVGYELIPTIVAQDGTITLAERDEREEILTRVEELSAELDRDN